jgi:hypothetical protein
VASGFRLAHFEFQSSSQRFQLRFHPWALIAALAGIAPGYLGPATAIGIGIASLGCRLVLLRRVERAFGLPPQSYCLVPLRDLLSFAVFASALPAVFGE